MSCLQRNVSNIAAIRRKFRNGIALARTVHVPTTTKLRETLYAILGLLVMSILGLQVQGDVGWTERSMISGEILLAASGVGTEYLEAASAMSFNDIAALDSQYTTALLPLERDTLNFDLFSRVEFVEKVGNAFVPAADTTDFQQVTVRIGGPLETGATMSQIYNRVSH